MSDRAMDADEEAPEDHRVDVESNVEDDQSKKSSYYNSTHVNSFDLRRMTLSFRDATFSVSGLGTLLYPVSGLYRGGEMVAMMGPSGSGKTTLLTMIAQKKTTKYQGSFLLNGHEVDPKLFPRFTGYVPQEEHLNGDMTVRECLFFYAMLKNQDMTRSQGKRRVEMLIEQLQLESCADSYIGTNTRRGISGGQKRRVNIGKVFANAPPIIFLDEPTSGLSATDALTVVQCLKKLATDHNILVVCVIHQPRYSVYKLFDKLLLLSSEGKCVYEGDANGIVDYFEMMGRPIPSYENPPDYILDVVTTTPSDSEKNKECIQRLADYVENNVKAKVDKQILELVPGPTLETVLHVKEKKLFDRSNFVRPTGFQTKILMEFQFKLRLRNWPELLRRLFMYLAIGILFGLVFFRTNASQKLAFNRVLSMWVIIGFAAIFTMEALPKVMDERVIYKYDRMDGVYGTVPYLLAVSVVLFVESFILTVIMGTVAYFLIGFSNSAGDFFFFLLFLVSVYWVTEGVMLLLATGCKDATQANGITVAVVGVLLVFSGLVVNTGSSPRWLSWLCWLSPYFYAFQSTMVMLFRHFTFAPTDCLHSLANIYSQYGIMPQLIWWNFLIILLWGIGYRCIVVIFLRYLHNPKV